MLEFLVARIKEGTDVLGKPFTIEDAYKVIENVVPKDKQKEFKNSLDTLLVAEGVTK